MFAVSLCQRRKKKVHTCLAILSVQLSRQEWELRVKVIEFNHKRCVKSALLKLSVKDDFSPIVLPPGENVHNPLHDPDLLSLSLSVFSLGWSVALVTPRCASGTSRQVSVYTSSWATWRQCDVSSTTGVGWSAVPTTSWSKCGTPRQKPASTRCRATPTEYTHYRWAVSHSHSVVGKCDCVLCSNQVQRYQDQISKIIGPILSIIHFTNVI